MIESSSSCIDPTGSVGGDQVKEGVESH